MGETAEALAGLALIFWHRLGLDLPDLILPVPDQKGSKEIFLVARLFAKLIQKPYVHALRRTFVGFLQSEISLSTDSIKTDQTVLLFDGESSLPWLKVACDKTAELFPKQAMVLSLF